MHQFTKKEDDLALSLGSTGYCIYWSLETAYMYLLLLQASFYQPIPSIVCLKGNIDITTVLHVKELSDWYHQSFVKRNG
jgi:hypothetical protein